MEEIVLVDVTLMKKVNHILTKRKSLKEGHFDLPNNILKKDWTKMRSWGTAITQSSWGRTLFLVSGSYNIRQRLGVVRR